MRVLKVLSIRKVEKHWAGLRVAFSFPREQTISNNPAVSSCVVLGTSLHLGPTGSSSLTGKGTSHMDRGVESGSGSAFFSSLPGLDLDVCVPDAVCQPV